MTRAIRSTPAASFSVARLGEHTWTVAYARRLIPGAILRTRVGALGYVRALARGAGIARVSVSVAGLAHRPIDKTRVARRTRG